MSNPQARGYTAYHTLIDKHGLQDVVLQMYSQGLSYREIIQSIDEKYNIHLSKMGISRFIARHTNQNIQPNTLISEFPTIREKSIHQTNLLFTALDKSFDDLKIVIQSSDLPPTQVSKILKMLDEKKKVLSKEIVEVRADTQRLFEVFSINSKTLCDVLVDISRGHCPSCRLHTSKVLKEFEKNNKQLV